jgi:hypothetical protein
MVLTTFDKLLLLVLIREPWLWSLPEPIVLAHVFVFGPLLSSI